MKKLFTLLTLALISIGSAWGQITTKTWDFTAITSSELTALKDNTSNFTDDSKNGFVKNKNEIDQGSITLALEDKDGNALSVAEGLLFGRNSGGKFSSGSFRYLYKNDDYYIYFNNSYCAIKLPSIKAGQEVVVVSKSYEGDYSLTNGSELLKTKGKASFIVSADGEVTIVFASKMADLQSIEVKNATPKHQVTYALGDGTGTAPTQADVKEEWTFTVADAPSDLVAPTGQEFKCWNDGTNDYNAGATYTMGASNVTLTAVYQTITTKYSITYSLGGGSGTAPTQADLAEGVEFTVAAAPGDLVAPTGKEFKCWNDGTNDYNAGATYTVGTSNVILTAVYQDKTYHGLTPTTTLDLSDASNTTFTTTWYTNNNMIKNSYYNAPGGVVSFSPYAIYQSTTSQTWAEKSSGNSGDKTWDNTGVFQGSSYYFSSSPKCAQLRVSRIHYYRVINCSGVSALVGGKAILEAYEVSADVVSADPVVDTSVDAAGTITLSGLNISKEYIIAIRGNNGDSNVTFSEIAFYFPAVTSTSVIIGAYQWATFCSDYALDFTGSGVKAYIVTGADGTAITKTEVTNPAAGTPLLLNASANTYNITVAASGTDYTSTNKLHRGAGTLTKPATGSAWVLAAVSGAAVFQYINGTSASVSTDQAYLLLTDVPTPTGARSLLIDGDATGIKNIKVGSDDNIYYDLQGRRVLYPTKGLYIVNGKKVVIK